MNLHIQLAGILGGYTFFSLNSRINLSSSLMIHYLMIQSSDKPT